MPYKDPAKQKEAYRRWYLFHIEETNEQNRKWYKENAEQRKVSIKAWVDANKDKRSIILRRCVIKHPEYSPNRNARARGAVGKHTLEEWQTKFAAYDYKCAYCSCELSIRTVTRDHIVPAYKGGSNTIENIVPACLYCNSHKGKKSVEEFLNEPK
jgi:5-methylcytosine-specific restriction endonuclease McrA